MQKPLLPGPELIRLQSYTLDEVKRYVQELNVTDAEKFYSLVRVVWDNLYVGDYWEMDEEFIFFWQYVSVVINHKVYGKFVG